LSSYLDDEDDDEDKEEASYFTSVVNIINSIVGTQLASLSYVFAVMDFKLAYNIIFE
jgi:hypothetical protein